MRQRNIKNKKIIIEKSSYVIREPEKFVNNWQSVFKNDNPIYIEIGMGKGRFILEMAINNPDLNFIGIEKYDSVLAIALKKIDTIAIPNLRIICMNAWDIDKIFNHEVDKIYLNFSDPWPKVRHAKRRLTSPCFLLKYDKIFRNDLEIEMKTDNQSLFEYSLISFSNDHYVINELSLDLHSSNKSDNIMTEYEYKFSQLNSKIYYVKVVKTR